MKKIKTFISLLAATALLFLTSGVGKLQVRADGPVTYSLKYVEANEEWRFHIGSWDDSNPGHRELYYLKESIKDGDLIVIEEGEHSLNLELPVRLSNITFNHSYTAVITAKSVDNVYVLRDSVGVVNGDVTNAYVYDDGVANFNNNVTNLYIMKERSGQQSIAVLGTVDYVKTADAEKVYNEFYNFQANSFRQEKGILKTDPSKYSLVPTVTAPVLPVVPTDPTLVPPVAPVTPVAPVVPTDPTLVPPVAPVTPVAPIVPVTGGEYDDVPKTGEPLALPALLILGAGICFGSAYLAGKNSRRSAAK
ncbi:MAG: hypothetical protein K1W26_05745 [Acetatifactor sp.]